MEQPTTRDCAHAGCNVIAWLHRLEDGVLRWYCREHFVKAPGAVFYPTLDPHKPVTVHIELEDVRGGLNKVYK